MKIRKSINIFVNQLKAGRINTIAVRRSLFGYRRTKTSMLPIYVQIEPTTLCNLRCESCSRDSYPKERLFGNLSFKNFKFIIDQIPSLCFVKLQGMGEPLLNRELFDMAKYVKSKGIVANVTSNGTLINQNNVDKILMFNTVVISFDGGTKETFEKLRVGAKFENVLNNLKLLVNKRKELGTKNKIILNFIASNQNYREIPLVAQLAKGIGIDELTIVPVQQWVDTKFSKTFNRVKKLKIADTDLKNEIEKTKQICRNSKTKLIYVLQNDPRYNPKACSYPWESCFITYDGCVTSCCLRMDPRIYNFGNIFKTPFKDIWNGEKYKAFRQYFLSKKIFPVCRNCPN